MYDPTAVQLLRYTQGRTAREQAGITRATGCRGFRSGAVHTTTCGDGVRGGDGTNHERARTDLVGKQYLDIQRARVRGECCFFAPLTHADWSVHNRPRLRGAALCREDCDSEAGVVRARVRFCGARRRSLRRSSRSSLVSCSARCRARAASLTLLFVFLSVLLRSSYARRLRARSFSLAASTRASLHTRSTTRASERFTGALRALASALTRRKSRRDSRSCDVSRARFSLHRRLRGLSDTVN